MAQTATFEVLVRRFGSFEPHSPLPVVSFGTTAAIDVVSETIFQSHKFSNYISKNQKVEILRNGICLKNTDTVNCNEKLDVLVHPAPAMVALVNPFAAPKSTLPKPDRSYITPFSPASKRNPVPEHVSMQPMVKIVPHSRVFVKVRGSSKPAKPLQLILGSPFTAQQFFDAVKIKHKRFESWEAQDQLVSIYRGRTALHPNDLVNSQEQLELFIHPRVLQPVVEKTICLFLKHRTNGNKFAAIQVTGSLPITVDRVLATLLSDYKFMLTGRLAVFFRDKAPLKLSSEVRDLEKLEYEEPDPNVINMKMGKIPSWIESRPRKSLRWKLARESTLGKEIETFKTEIRQLIESFRRYSKCSVFKTEQQLLERQRRQRPYLKNPFPVKADDIDSPEMLYGIRFDNRREMRTTQSDKPADPSPMAEGTAGTSDQNTAKSTAIEIMDDLEVFAAPLDISLTDAIKGGKYAGRVFSLVQQWGTGKTKECMDLAFVHGLRVAWLTFQKGGKGAHVGKVLLQGFRDIAERVTRHSSPSSGKLMSMAGKAAEELSRHFIQALRIAILCFPKELTPTQVLKLQHIPSVSQCIARFLTRTLALPSYAFDMVTHLQDSMFEVPWSFPSALVADETSVLASARAVPQSFNRISLSCFSENCVIDSFIAACLTEARNLAFCVAMTGDNLQMAAKRSSVPTGDSVIVVQSERYVERGTLQSLFEHYFGIPFPEREVENWECRWRFVADRLLRAIFLSTKGDRFKLLRAVPLQIDRVFHLCVGYASKLLEISSNHRMWKGHAISMGCDNLGWKEFVAVWYLKNASMVLHTPLLAKKDAKLRFLESGLFYLSNDSTGKFYLETKEAAPQVALRNYIETGPENLPLKYLDKSLVSRHYDENVWKDYVLYTLVTTGGQALIDAFAGPTNLPHPCSSVGFDPTVLFYSLPARGCVVDGPNAEATFEHLNASDSFTPSWILSPSEGKAPDFFTVLIKFGSFNEALSQHAADSPRFRQLLGLRHLFDSAPWKRPLLVKCHRVKELSDENLQRVVNSVRLKKPSAVGPLQTQDHLLKNVYSHQIQDDEYERPENFGNHVVDFEPPVKRRKYDDGSELMDVSDVGGDSSELQVPWAGPASQNILQVLREQPSLADWSLGVLAVASPGALTNKELFPPTFEGHCGFSVLDARVLKHPLSAPQQRPQAPPLPTPDLTSALMKQVVGDYRENSSPRKRTSDRRIKSNHLGMFGGVDEEDGSPMEGITQ
eukprot:TRINITY_DN8112_c0_g1_i1.p1 TRINITY_DN8112_c0_g1~~TRINITY_DN8112_c0_g1_i1.p1  ORF type:complete len:1240 (+),score=184.82 TRINITY_DN8112_c0_g1_i1:250-3969(+)